MWCYSSFWHSCCTLSQDHTGEILYHILYWSPPAPWSTQSQRISVRFCLCSCRRGIWESQPSSLSEKSIELRPDDQSEALLPSAGMVSDSRVFFYQGTNVKLNASLFFSVYGDFSGDLGHLKIRWRFEFRWCRLCLLQRFLGNRQSKRDWRCKETLHLSWHGDARADQVWVGLATLSFWNRWDVEGIHFVPLILNCCL